jgi:uncharacterized cupredoxin-like copper-binding protein
MAVAAGVALLLTACSGGSDDDEAAADRTVRIEMRDIAFSPGSISVAAGETVRFEFDNVGELDHDAFIGDEDAQVAHEREMREADEGGHGGHGDNDGDAITVEPGDNAQLTHTFERAGTIVVGCHQPGHYDAGMKVVVTVA